MKKVLADFADDADFSGRNILKFFFSRNVAKCFAKSAKIFKSYLIYLADYADFEIGKRITELGL